MTQSTDKQLIPVVVPVDAHSFKIDNPSLGTKFPYVENLIWEGAFIQEGPLHRMYQHLNGLGHTFVGTVSFKDGQHVIEGFDPAEYVENLWEQNSASYSFAAGYKHYVNDSLDGYTSDDSFVSSLEKEFGLYWVNQLGEKEPDKDFLYDELNAQAKHNGFRIGSEEEEDIFFAEMDRIFEESFLDPWRAAESRKLSPDVKLAILAVNKD